MKPSTPATGLLAAWALLLTMSSLAGAQATLLDPRAPFAGPRTGLRFVPAPDDAANGPLRSQHPVPPLPPALQLRVARATQERWSGNAAVARDSLQALLREVPHHALIASELARAQLQLEDWPAVAKLARAERAIGRDSLLLAREGAMAEERLAHAREAMAIAMEAWMASAGEADWAMRTVLKLAPMQPRAAKDALRLASMARPERQDLARGRALLLARTGAPLEAARALDAPDAPGAMPLRLRTAEDLLLARDASASDSAAAIEMLLATASDPRGGSAWRLSAARRVWPLAQAGVRSAEVALALAHALATIGDLTPPDELTLGLARALSASGQAREARALLERRGNSTTPAIQQELLLAEAREGSPERVLEPLAALAASWPGARFMLAEVRFWTGRADSALATYQQVAADPAGADAGAALERTYLIEETASSSGLAAYGRIVYEEWRGNTARARALTDSLLATLTRTQPLWPHVSLRAGEQRLAADAPRMALVPLLALADSLPADRLAPRARERAGDALLALHDEAGALAQYEDCLARYPRAWNAPGVRRRVEALRKDRRF